MQKITTYLWFKNRDAEEAMNYYVDTFKNARIIDITRFPDDVEVGPHPDMGGLVLNGIFELEGQRYGCIDGGPEFTFNESISLMVACEDQAEIDDLWSKLSAVPEAEACGWCKDKFGLSWQIVPANLGELLQTPDQMQAMLKMKKLNIAELEAAGGK